MKKLLLLTLFSLAFVSCKKAEETIAPEPITQQQNCNCGKVIESHPSAIKLKNICTGYENWFYITDLPPYGIKPVPCDFGQRCPEIGETFCIVSYMNKPVYRW